MTSRWIHWSAKPKERPSAATRLQIGSKPHVGHPLWVSDENDYGWRKWCEDNEFMLSALKHAYEVTFKPTQRVLYIRDDTHLDEFTRLYAVRDPALARYRSMRSMNLDWLAIAAAFDAILITPHLSYPLNNIPMWYYGWDCASGVVLDPVCIDSWTDVTAELVK